MNFEKNWRYLVLALNPSIVVFFKSTVSFWLIWKRIIYNGNVFVLGTFYHVKWDLSRNVRTYRVFPTQAWTDNSKWALHGDMLRQYAGCVADNMPGRRNNMSVRMDVWGSLNGRFHQRLVDPDEDLLHATWSPWSPAPWLLPLLRHLDAWRPWIEDAKDRAADDRLLFFADFPGKRSPATHPPPLVQ